MGIEYPILVNIFVLSEILNCSVLSEQRDFFFLDVQLCTWRVDLFSVTHHYLSKVYVPDNLQHLETITKC